MNDEMKYEEALAQLETIVRKMENNDYTIDELTEQLKTAQQLIKLCREKLTKTEAELLEEQAKGQ
jgi:exodeoxyribonuclease VII small subunit